MIEAADATSALDPLLRSVGRELAELLARPLASGLYLVATPIGHLGDVTLRALAIMSRADALYCEDTRHSRKLLDRYSIRRPLRSYHEHNAGLERPMILAELRKGRSVALISDAGTPLVSDPGFKLVRAALDGGFRAFSVPGASAVLAGLTASGLPSDSFTFAGFLPVKAGQRLERLRELADAAGTLIFFEAPGRVATALAALGEVFGPGTPAAVARELTKLHEEMRTGSLAELSAWADAQSMRGEAVILVAPARHTPKDATDEEITQALAGEKAGSLRDRVDAVAARLRTQRKRVYDLALLNQEDRQR